MNRYLLPWKEYASANAWSRRPFPQDNITIATVYKDSNLLFDNSELYLGGTGIPFRYGYSIFHEGPISHINKTVFSFSIKSVMKRCDKLLVELGYELLSEERLEKLKLLL